MTKSLKSWLGEVTTGHGFIILGTTLLSLITDVIAWQTAIPLIAAGIAGLLWPENPAMKPAAQTAARDMVELAVAWRGGAVPPDSGPVQPR